MAGGGGLLTIPALMAAGVPPVSGARDQQAAEHDRHRVGVPDLLARRPCRPPPFRLPRRRRLAGSVLGATAVQHVRSDFLAAFVPVLLIAMGLYFLLAPPMSSVDRHARVGAPGLTLIVTALGFYDGFFGPGTGSASSHDARRAGRPRPRARDRQREIPEPRDEYCGVARHDRRGPVSSGCSARRWRPPTSWATSWARGLPSASADAGSDLCSSSCPSR